jgi:hypothetical protein
MKPPPSRRGKCAGLAVALALLLASDVSAADERPTVYRWLDESGVAHYTTQPGRIPSEFRDGAQEVGRPAPTSAPSESVGATAPPTSNVTPPPEPPPVAAPPPSGARVTPEGEFEEPPLGSGSRSAPGPTSSAAPDPSNVVPAPASAPPAPPSAAPIPASSAASAPSSVASAPASAPSSSASSAAPLSSATPPRDDEDVAAPPPGYSRDTAPNAPAQAPPPVSPPTSKQAPTAAEAAPVDAAALEERISALEAQVERDQSLIQNILSEPRPADSVRVAEREDFREIAQRLPKLQADLKALREQRARQSGP